MSLLRDIIELDANEDVTIEDINFIARTPVIATFICDICGYESKELFVDGERVAAICVPCLTKHDVIRKIRLRSVKTWIEFGE